MCVWLGIPLPTFIHYCQFYRAGELGFQKRRVSKKIFSCDTPILLEPPVDLAAADYIVKDGKVMLSIVLCDDVICCE